VAHESSQLTDHGVAAWNLDVLETREGMRPELVDAVSCLSGENEYIQTVKKCTNCWSQSASPNGAVLECFDFSAWTRLKCKIEVPADRNSQTPGVTLTLKLCIVFVCPTTRCNARWDPLFRNADSFHVKTTTTEFIDKTNLVIKRTILESNLVAVIPIPAFIPCFEILPLSQL
jgi:hypothetical protein